MRTRTNERDLKRQEIRVKIQDISINFINGIKHKSFLLLLVVFVFLLLIYKTKANDLLELFEGL